MRSPFAAAHGTTEERRGVIVQIVDSDGRRGVGEASPLPSFFGGTHADVLAFLERYGASLLTDVSPLTGPGSMALRCALDVAALDLEAQQAGTSVAALLSPDALDRVPVNAVIGDGPPDEIAQIGVEATSRGYRVLKLKVGTGTLAEDLERVRALRAACPRASIHLDANGAWDEATAIDAVIQLDPLGIGLIEQPVPAADVEALARVHARSTILLGADEAMADPVSRERVLALGAAYCVILKPMVLGGLRPALEIGRRATSQGMRAIVTTTFDSSIGTATSLALACALPHGPSHGLATGEHLAGDVVTHTLVPELGVMVRPAMPGLGVEVDEAALERVATAPWSERAL